MEGWTSCVDNADATRSVRCARFSTYDAPAVAAAIEHHGGVLEFPYVSLALVACRKEVVS